MNNGKSLEKLKSSHLLITEEEINISLILTGSLFEKNLSYYFHSLCPNHCDGCGSDVSELLVSALVSPPPTLRAIGCREWPLVTRGAGWGPGHQSLSQPIIRGHGLRWSHHLKASHLIRGTEAGPEVKSVTVSSNYFNCNWLFRFTPHYRGGVLEIRNRPIILLARIRISNTEVPIPGNKRQESILWKLSKDTDVSWEPRDYSQLTLEFFH